MFIGLRLFFMVITVGRVSPQGVTRRILTVLKRCRVTLKTLSLMHKGSNCSGAFFRRACRCIDDEVIRTRKCGVVDLFARQAQASVTSIMLTLFQSVQRCFHPDQICGPHRQDAKTSIQLYDVAKNEIDNDFKLRFNELRKRRSKIIAMKVYARRCSSALRISRRLDIVTKASSVTWKAGTGALSWSASAMLDFPALVGPCKMMAGGFTEHSKHI